MDLCLSDPFTDIQRQPPSFTPQEPQKSQDEDKLNTTEHTKKQTDSRRMLVI